MDRNSQAATFNFGAAALRRDRPATEAGGPAALVFDAPPGPGAAARHPVGDAPVTVGRDPSCDVVVDHPSVSRRHARVERAAGGGFRVTDFGSTNGTVVYGARVTEAVVRAGDEVWVGDVRFRVVTDPEG